MIAYPVDFATSDARGFRTDRAPTSEVPDVRVKALVRLRRESSIGPIRGWFIHNRVVR